MGRAARLVVPVLGFVGVLALAPAAGAQQEDLVGDREITVTPSTGLTDGQTVTVSWSGFTPDSKVTVIQCADASGLKSEICNTTDAKFDLPAGPEGEGSTELVVRTGPIGPDGQCDAEANNDCAIAANEDLKDGVTATRAISFAAGTAPASGALAETGSTTFPLAAAGAAAVGIGVLATAKARRLARASG